MLESLHIKNFVLIDSLDIEFPEGLVIISGPTGAGKSLLLGALGLLLGKKADASIISSGSDICVVEGEFLCESPSIEAFCKEEDIDYNGGHFIIRRVVSSSGRSRAFVNDEPVVLSALERLGGHLVDIHSQHETLLLTSRSYQLSVLDAYADNADLLQQCNALFCEKRRVDAEIDALETRMDAMVAELEFNQAQLSQISSAGIREGELAELESRQYSLSHSEQIKVLLSEAAELFNPSDANATGVNSALSSVSRNLHKLSEYIPEYKSLAERLESSRIELKDISGELSERNEALSCDPETLQKIDDRLGLIYGLMRRFGVSDEVQLLEKKKALEQSVFGVDDLQEQLSGLKSERDSVQKRLLCVSDKLHESRSKAAPSFSKLIMDCLSYMELDKAVFAVSLAPVAVGPSGGDECSFQFSATGSVPVPVAKCASGGEMSRIMLSLKNVMSSFMNMPTMIFDEIDTGVSGSVADRMGRVICDMGKRMQVFAITHLPQVAAKGDAHYLVGKSGTGEHTVSTIKKLSRQERVLEVARMLSGATLTDEAVANAKSLLD